MRFFITVSLILNVFALYGQSTNDVDSLQPPTYDTTNIDIVSKNSFYFCKKLYTIPRICDNKDQSNCCSFNAQINKREGKFFGAQIGCNDGTTLHWTQFEKVELAKQYFESLPGQIKTQMKRFKQERVKFYVLNTELPAYKLTCTTDRGYSFVDFIFYGELNGEIIFGRFTPGKGIKSSNALSQFYQQFVRF